MHWNICGSSYTIIINSQYNYHIMKLSIIVPCYNEADNLSLILDGFNKAIKGRNDIELIIVNNGSRDNSKEILGDLLPKYKFARCVDVNVNQGYGFGILSGLREAKGEFIGWTHGDFQTPPSDTLKALEIIERSKNPKNIYIKGLRKRRPFFDKFFTFGMGVFESLYIGKLFYDINAQPNIFHKSFFKTWNNPPYDFSLDLYALYLAKSNKDIAVVRFPVFFLKRIHGESHWNKNLLSKLKFIKRTILFSIELKKRFKK